MSRGPSCLTCASPDRAAIDAAILAGRLSLSQIARDFGLKTDTVRRHKVNAHVDDLKVRPAGKAAPIIGDDDSTAAMRRQAMAVLRNIDPERIGPGILIQRMNAIRLMAADIDKATPPQRAEVRIEDVSGMPELVGDWYKILEPHPAIREQFLAALRRHSAALAGEIS